MAGNATTFDDPHAWLKAVRDAELEPGATMIPRDSVDGTVLGFTEADTRAEARRWSCPRALVQAATRGAQAPLAPFRERLATYHGRRVLVLDLRAGKIQLPEPLPPTLSEPEVVAAPSEPEPGPELVGEAMSDYEIFTWLFAEGP